MRQLHASAFVALALLGLSCASYRAHKETLRLENEGDLATAYQVAHAASIEHPEDEKLEQDVLRIGGNLVTERHELAKQLPQHDLPGRRRLLEEALKFKSSRKRETQEALSQLQEEEDSLLRAISHSEQVDDPLLELWTCWQVHEYREFLPAISEFILRCEGNSGRIENALHNLEASGRIELQVVYGVAASTIFPSAPGFRTCLDKALQSQSHSILASADALRKAPSHERLGHLIWYASAAQRAFPTQEFRATLGGLLELARQERKYTALFQVSSPLKDDSGVINAFAQELDDALIWAKPIETLPTEASPQSVLVEIDLVDVALQQTGKVETQVSQFLAGTITKPNPQYSQTYTAYQVAVADADREEQEEYQRKQLELQRQYVQSQSGGPQIIYRPSPFSGVSAALARDRANKLARQLEQIPQYVEVPTYQDYSFAETQRTFMPLVRLKYEVTDLASADTVLDGEWRQSKTAVLTHRPDVHSADSRGYERAVIDDDAGEDLLDEFCNEQKLEFAKFLAAELNAIHNTIADRLVKDGYRQQAIDMLLVGSFIAGREVASADPSLEEEVVSALKKGLDADRIATEVVEARGVLNRTIPEDCKVRVLELLAQHDPLQVAYEPDRPVTATACRPESEPRPAESRTSPPSSLVESVLESVVVVSAGDSVGSGFFVTEDLIVTNYHVVENAKLIQVSIGGSRRIASIEEVRVSKDLALLRVEGFEGRALPLGRTSDVVPGMEVLAFGAPAGFDQTVTRGIVSAIRQLPSAFNSNMSTTFIQSDAPISPGSSGGPLVSADGTVIGVCTKKKVGVDYEGLSFAIPADDVRASFGSYLQP